MSLATCEVLDVPALDRDGRAFPALRVLRFERVLAVLVRDLKNEGIQVAHLHRATDGLFFKGLYRRYRFLTTSDEVRMGITALIATWFLMGCTPTPAARKHPRKKVKRTSQATAHKSKENQ